MKIGRFTIRFKYPPKPDLLLLEADKSPHLLSVCEDLSFEIYRSIDRLLIVRPRYILLLIKYWWRTSRMAALLCARLECQKIRILIGMENYDKFNRIGDLSRTLLDDVTAQIPQLNTFLVQHGQELRRLALNRPSKRVELFCWGNWVARNYPSFGRNEQRFTPVGALIDGLYRSIRPVVIPRDVKVCYVSTVKESSWWGNEVGERRFGYETLTKYLSNFQRTSQVDIHVALTIDRDQNKEVDESALERKWFLERLGNSIQFTEPSLLFGDQNFSDHGRQTPGMSRSDTHLIS